MMLTTLNISSNAVRYLVARSGSIVDWGKVPLPGVMQNGMITHPETAGARVKSLFASRKLPRERVVLSFNGLPFSYRLISLPKMAQPALSEAVTRAARKEMPLSLDDMYLSWQAYPDGREEWECLVLGVTPPPVDALMRTFAVAGIRPCVLDIKHLLLSELNHRRDAIIVDFESDFTHIALVAGGIPVGMHTVPSFGPAAQLGDEIAMLSGELARMVGFYNSSHPERPLPETASLLLTGELSADPSVATALQNESGYRVERLVPSLDVPPALPVHEYAANIGAVLKNAVPARTAAGAPPFFSLNLDKIVRSRKPAPKTVGIIKRLCLPVVLAAALGLLAGGLWLQYQSQADVAQLRAGLAQADRTLAQSLALVDQSARDEADIAKLATSAQALQDKNQSILAPETYVEDLSRLVLALPVGVSFDSFDMRAGQVVVKGTAAGSPPVVQFARNVESSGVFTRADIMWIKKATGSAGGVSFMVVIDK
jgi:Tfp pilus assembly protein PilN